MNNCLALIALCIFLIFNEVGLAQNNKKMILLEEFTNAACPACGYRNPELYDMILKEYPNDVIHIAYHNNRPLSMDTFYLSNPAPPLARTDFYNISGSPSVVLNGKNIRPSKPLLEPLQIEQELGAKSAIGLSIEEEKNGNKRKVKINTERFENLPNGDYKIFVAVVEKHIVFCTYFEYVFDNVFRAFLTSKDGDTFSVAENKQELKYEFAVKEEWNNEQLYIVAFIQDIRTKNIINASASQPIDNAKTHRYSDDAFSLLASVYDDVCGTGEGSIDLDLCISKSPFKNPTNLSFNWSNGATTEDIYNLSAGFYSVKITNNIDGTTSEHTYEIKANSKISVVTNNRLNTNGTGNIITVNASGGTGGLSILWNTGSQDFSIDDMDGGIYSFVIADENGCTYENSIEIERVRIVQSADIELTVSNVSCAGKKDGSISLPIEDNLSIIWFLGDKTGVTTNGLSAGDYTFIALNNNGDLIDDGSFTITEPTPLQITTSTTSSGFETPFISVDKVTGGTAPYNYIWSNGAKTPLLENIGQGTYNVQVFDANGCVKTETATVYKNEINIKHLNCFGDNTGAIEIDVKDGQEYTFNWSNGSIGSVVRNLSGGQYDLDILKENEPFRTLNFIINEPSAFTLQLNYNKNVKPFIIETIVSGGITPYTFKWSNGSNEQFIESPEEGTHNLNVTDANGCKAQADLAVEIESLTAIETHPLANIDIFPNPAQQTAYVKNAIFDQPIKMFALNANQQKVNLNYTIINNLVQINVEDLPSGVYVIGFQPENKNIYYEKIIVCK